MDANFVFVSKTFFIFLQFASVFIEIARNLLQFERKFDASPGRQGQRDRKSKAKPGDCCCLDVHLSVKSECTLEMLATNFPTERRATLKIDNLLVLRNDWEAAKLIQGVKAEGRRISGAQRTARCCCHYRN